MLNEISHFNHDGKMWHVIEDAGMFYAHDFSNKTDSYATQEALLTAFVSGSAKTLSMGSKSTEGGSRVVLKKKKASRKPASQRLAEDESEADPQSSVPSVSHNPVIPTEDSTSE
jgi:hypothetical protein